MSVVIEQAEPIDNNEDEGTSVALIILAFFGALLCGLFAFCLCTYCRIKESKDPRTLDESWTFHNFQHACARIPKRLLKGSSAYNSEAAPMPEARDPSPVVDPEEELYEIPVVAPKMQKRRHLRNLDT